MKKWYLVEIRDGRSDWEESPYQNKNDAIADGRYCYSLKTDRERAHIDDMYIAYFDDEIGPESAKKEYSVMPGPWYAVLDDEYDGWDYGSYDLKQARRMLKTAGPGAYIAVIDEKHSYCMEEIRE